MSNQPLTPAEGAAKLISDARVNLAQLQPDRVSAADLIGAAGVQAQLATAAALLAVADAIRQTRGTQ